MTEFFLAYATLLSSEKH